MDKSRTADQATHARYRSAKWDAVMGGVLERTDLGKAHTCTSFLVPQ